jgi:hypothetical protein
MPTVPPELPPESPGNPSERRRKVHRAILAPKCLRRCASPASHRLPMNFRARYLTKSRRLADQAGRSFRRRWEPSACSEVMARYCSFHPKLQRCELKVVEAIFQDEKRFSLARKLASMLPCRVLNHTCALRGGPLELRMGSCRVLQNANSSKREPALEASVPTGVPLFPGCAWERLLVQPSVPPFWLLAGCRASRRTLGPACDSSGCETFCSCA